MNYTYFIILDKSKETSYIITIPGQTVRNDLTFIEAYKNSASNEFKDLAKETCDTVSTNHNGEALHEKVPKVLSGCHAHPSYGMTPTFPKNAIPRAPILLLV